jgi:ATP synthase protein I
MQEADPARSRSRAVEGARSTSEPNAPSVGTDVGAPDDVPFAPEADWVREQRGSLQYAGVGIQFGLTISLFALLGRWLDGRFGTSPWLLLLGVLLGFGGGTYSLLKKVSNGAS